MRASGPLSTRVYEWLRAAGDVQAGFDADTRFHRALVDASGLPGVWDVVARVAWRDAENRGSSGVS